MAVTHATPIRASFQPRPERESVASVYLLWMISNKTFVKPSGCWHWSGPRSEGGYGVMEVKGKIHRVTRLVYEYCIGDLPDESLVLHSCDNPPCCNLAHLRAGDRRDNMLDCLARGQHPSVLLNEDMVRQIRGMAKGPPRWSRKRLAERFGVTLATIDDVVDRRSWRHVE